MLVDDGEQLLDRLLEVVVHDHLVGDGQPDRLLVEGLAHPLGHLVLGVAPAPQAALLLLAARREDEDQEGLRVLATDLLGPVDLDLEHHVGAGRGLGRGRAVVVAQEVGPLEEAAPGDRGPRRPPGW